MFIFFADIGQQGQLSINNVETDSITVSWTDQSSVGGNPINSFQLEYVPSEPAGSPRLQTLARNNRLATISGLIPGKLYTFILRGSTSTVGLQELDRLNENTGESMKHC